MCFWLIFAAPESFCWRIFHSPPRNFLSRKKNFLIKFLMKWLVDDKKDSSAQKIGLLRKSSVSSDFFVGWYLGKCFCRNFREIFENRQQNWFLPFSMKFFTEFLIICIAIFFWVFSISFWFNNNQNK